MNWVGIGFWLSAIVGAIMVLAFIFSLIIDIIDREEQIKRYTVQCFIIAAVFILSACYFGDRYFNHPEQRKEIQP